MAKALNTSNTDWQKVQRVITNDGCNSSFCFGGCPVLLDFFFRANQLSTRRRHAAVTGDGGGFSRGKVAEGVKQPRTFVRAEPLELRRRVWRARTRVYKYGGDSIVNGVNKSLLKPPRIADCSKLRLIRPHQSASESPSTRVHCITDCIAFFCMMSYRMILSVYGGSIDYHISVF